jgi:hypothetical protein
MGSPKAPKSGQAQHIIEEAATVEEPATVLLAASGVSSIGLRRYCGRRFTWIRPYKTG